MTRSTFLTFLFFFTGFQLSAQVVGTFAGQRNTSGFEDGPGDEATFSNPHGIAISPQGNIYLSDRFNHTIRKITPEGLVSTLAGNPGTIGDAEGLGSESLFYEPWGICVDANENVFVADTRNNKIKKISPEGIVSTYAGTGNYGTTNGPANASTFGLPVGIESDGAGRLYVADHGTHIIRKIDQDGTVSILAGIPYTTGDNDGPGNSATFNKPYGLTIDIAGNILVADEWNHKIRRISPDGLVTTVAGTGEAGSQDGIGTTARFNYPWDVTVDSAGVIYVADGLNHAIRKIIPEGAIEVETIAGELGVIGNQDGIGTTARFSGATGIAFSPLSRELFVADAYNNLIRKVTDPGQGVFLRPFEGITSICPENNLSIHAYPDIYDQYHFYLNGELITTDQSILDTLGLASGFYTLRVVAELDTFQVESEIINLEIFELAQASLDIVGETTFFEGDSVVLIASFGAEYFWSNGAITPTITVKESGNYTVEITDENGCVSISETLEITVRRDPDDIFIVMEGPISFCEGESVELRSTILEQTQWLKDNWPIEGATNEVYEATESGIYRVQYTDDNGTVVISEPVEITVWPNLELDFRVDKTAVKPGDQVQFLLLNEDLVDWEWNFGDPDSGGENVSKVADPIHQYESTGYYDIYLTGSNEEGCADTLLRSEYIWVSTNASANQNEDDVFVATAFTPNADGVNDVLYVRGTDVVSMNFKIFSPKGKLVFESNNRENGWDGFYKNKKALVGNYIYQLNYTNLLGLDRQKSGVITLLK